MNNRANLRILCMLLGLLATHEACGSSQDCFYPASDPSTVTVSAAKYNDAIAAIDGGGVDAAMMDNGQPGYVGEIEGAPCLTFCPGKETSCSAWVEDGGASVSIQCHPGCG